MSSTNPQETRNLEIVRRGYEAFATEDMETMKTLIAQNAHWHDTPTALSSGDFDGQQAILEYFGQLMRETEGTIKVTPIAMAAAGDRVFVLNHLSAKRGQRTLETNNVNVFTLANGSVVDTVVYSGNQPAAAAFFS